jgi:hypothetical protein
MVSTKLVLCLTQYLPKITIFVRKSSELFGLDEEKPCAIPKVPGLNSRHHVMSQSGRLKYVVNVCFMIEVNEKY